MFHNLVLVKWEFEKARLASLGFGSVQSMEKHCSGSQTGSERTESVRSW